MGACRAVSRMRRRSRARRPAHGVCVVSFLRLAQRSRRAARAHTGACRAVSRMRRRSRARRPAHGVCVVSFLRLAQRSRHAARSTRDAPARAHAPASRGVPLVRVGCCAHAPCSRVRRASCRGFRSRWETGVRAQAATPRNLGPACRLAHVCVLTARARAHARASGRLPSSGLGREAIASRRLRPVRVRKAPPSLSPSARLRGSRGPGPAACVPGSARARFARASRFLCAQVLPPCHLTARANAPLRAPRAAF